VSLFVDGGPTVQIRAANGDVRVENDVYPGTLYQGPMAVLVNRFSASASEIFTGAMQDYGRALIVGGDTFGKGTVQTLLDLNYGDIKITEAKFYRVSGSSNQLKGIIPDISLPFIVNKEDIGESALPNALPWDHIAAADYTPMFNFGPYLDALVKAHDARVAKQPDFLYAMAMDKLLKENRARKSLSLNQDERSTLRNKLDSETLAIENQRRTAEGEKPLASMDELRKLEDEKNLDPEDASSDKPDAYLKETGMILGDLAALMKDKKLAATDFWK
jgi:carboxyl-terminal processing protease